MASTVLPNGIIIPEKFSRDWYNDLYHNWQELDNLLGGGTPKDGTLTIQKNGTTVGTFSANQATNETVNIEVPTVNDATLTIQKNGTDVATFSANSSTNATANITVPTKTSDLTNDSNFVQSSDLATVATSGSYNDLSNKPTIPSKTSDLTNDSGFITSDNTKIPLAGSNQISGSLIPATTDAYDLGSPSYQWNNAYIKSLTINGVACGDILTHNVSEFVNVSSNQTIGGTKTFSDDIRNKKVQHFISNKEYNDTTDNWLNIHNYIDKNSTRFGFYSIGDFNGNRSFRWFVRGQLTNSVEADIFGFGRKINETSFMYINATLETDLIPTNNNSKSLGTSTNKWKSLNGINPGALSLPSNNAVNILSELQSDGYTAPSNGYVRAIKNVRTHCASTIGIRNETTGIEDRKITERAFTLGVMVPVQAGEKVTISDDWNSVSDATAIYSAYFYPCQGNV